MQTKKKKRGEGGKRPSTRPQFKPIESGHACSQNGPSMRVRLNGGFRGPTNWPYLILRSLLLSSKLLVHAPVGSRGVGAVAEGAWNFPTSITLG
jgi:hypothetical protein